MNWNPCPQWGGLLVRNQLESLSGMDWNCCPEWGGIPNVHLTGKLSVAMELNLKCWLVLSYWVRFVVEGDARRQQQISSH